MTVKLKKDIDFLKILLEYIYKVKTKMYFVHIAFLHVCVVVEDNPVIYNILNLIECCGHC